MKAKGFIRTNRAILVVALAMHVSVTGCQANTGGVHISPEQQTRLVAMQAKGTEASVTVFPVVIGGEALPDAAGVVAVLLEQAGMTNLEMTDAVFRAPEQPTIENTAERFGEFVRANPVKTDYALYGEFVFTQGAVPTEIRGVVVDNAGQPVLVDRQTAADRAFKQAKPSCLMDCCVFLAERVRTQLGIPASARDDTGQGRLARRFSANAPGPDKAERTAMEQRLATMKKAAGNATVAVYPVRLSENATGSQDAAQLAERLTTEGLCKATAVDSPLTVKVKNARNLQKTLWDLAAAFQDHVRRNPPEADYAMIADYIMHPSGKRAWAVHFVLCDRNGEWVIVDFQNDHHRDFQSVDPKTLDDCGRLVTRRLQGYLR